MNFRRRCSKFLLNAQERAANPKRPRIPTLLLRHPFSSSQANKDLYKILGVDRSSSDSDIKKAYFKLAKQWHPDVNESADAKDKFAEISGAYETLIDKDKRAQYDMFGSAGPAGANPFGGQTGGFSSFEDIFETLFGGGAARAGRGSSRRRSAGNDIQIQETLTFMEAIDGCKKTIDVKRMEKCEVCDTSGMEPGTKPLVCKQCGGSGRIRHQQGMMYMEQSCPFCQGEGSTFVPCRHCDGHGLTSKAARLAIGIAPGVSDAMKVKVAEQGDASRYGGPRGNVYVHIRVLEHPVFLRHNNDIHIEMSLPLSVAIQGGKLTVPLLKGDHDLEIDPGVQHGDSKVIRGQGVKDFTSRIRGHQYVHFRIDIPRKLSDEQRTLLKEWEKLETDAPKVIERENSNLGN